MFGKEADTLFDLWSSERTCPLEANLLEHERIADRQSRTQLDRFLDQPYRGLTVLTNRLGKIKSRGKQFLVRDDSLDLPHTERFLCIHRLPGE